MAKNRKINSGSNATEKALTIVTLTTQKLTFIYNFHPVCVKLSFVFWCLFIRKKNRFNNL